MNRLIRRILVQAVGLGLALAGFAATGGQTPSDGLGRAEPVAVTSNQVSVTPPPMGWASWNTFAAKINYNVIKAQADAFVAAGTAGGRVQVRQHRRGLVAGHPRRPRQHHRRHRRVARRYERHRRLHPQQGPQGGHLYRRRQGRLRLLLPDRPPGGARHWQRGPLRAGHAASSPSGASTSSRSTGAAATPRASTRRPRTRRSATPTAKATAQHRPRSWCCRSATGASRTPGTGAPAWLPCGAPARTSSTTASRRRWTSMLANFDYERCTPPPSTPATTTTRTCSWSAWRLHRRPEPHPHEPVGRSPAPRCWPATTSPR